MQLLGLAARAGAVAAGTQRVRDGVRAGTVRFAFVAADLTATGRDKLLPLLEGSSVPFAVRYDRVDLGRAVGKSPLAAVGVTDRGFADRFAALLADG
ncbi:MAG: ribosomal L7Ae/L30e/S12e/Gadd45 family protein [Gemmatimonadota bacterium]